MSIKAILFDVFGTLLDMSSIKATEEGRAELREYGKHLREFQETGVYKPLVLPEHWEGLLVFPDVLEGVNRLGGKFDLRTFSNGPVGLTDFALQRQGVFMGWVDVSVARGFKPAAWIYPWAAGRIRLSPSECLMVTANATFGDLEGAAACGMQAQLIRGDSDCPDLLALAERLGC